MNQPEICEHLFKWENLIATKKQECDECVKTGDRWVHLRTCQTCGVTLCCDSSTNKHASKHANQANHFVAISAERGERWAWCYQHNQLVEY
jgi:hypothetical protein